MRLRMLLATVAVPVVASVQQPYAGPVFAQDSGLGGVVQEAGS
jgi:hypothetical protein